MDPAGFRYTVGFNGSNDPEHTTAKGVWYGGTVGTPYLNFTHVDLAGYACERPDPRCDKRIASIGVHIGSNSSRFSYQRYYFDMDVSPWAMPSAWPDDDALRQAITLRNEVTYTNWSIAFFYGTLDSTTAQLHGIACYDDFRQGRANVTYDMSTQSVISVRPAEKSFVALSNYSGATALKSSLDTLLPNGDLWGAALNNTPEASFDTRGGSAQLATQIDNLYNNFHTQYYNTVIRDQNFTADTEFANATLHDENYQRIFQSAISTRILEALLLSMWLCACIIYYLFDTKTLLPKNPCSIAAQASLLAESKFLDMIPEGAETATLEELMQMTPFKDHLFSMGWWDDGNGGRRFGIDVGMTDFDKGEDEAEKVGESEGGGGGVEDVEEGLVGKVDARVSVDIVGSRV
jgi:hypothetical protein